MPSVFDSSSSSSDSESDDKKKVLIQENSKGKLDIFKNSQNELQKKNSSKDLNSNK